MYLVFLCMFVVLYVVIVVVGMCATLAGKSGLSDCLEALNNQSINQLVATNEDYNIMHDTQCICDWIWQNKASTHKASLGDMAILRNHCVITSQCLQLCKQNLHQLFIYLLAITEWVYTFLIPKICPVLGSFFRADNNITGGSNRVGGGGMGLI